MRQQGATVVRAGLDLPGLREWSLQQGLIAKGRCLVWKGWPSLQGLTSLVLGSFTQLTGESDRELESQMGTNRSGSHLLNLLPASKQQVQGLRVWLPQTENATGVDG